MANRPQEIFKRIVLHNKLLAEAQLDALLGQFSNPEQVIKQMVDQKLLPVNTATQLLNIYRKQLTQVIAKPAAPGSAPPAGPPAASPSAPATAAAPEAGAAGVATTPEARAATATETEEAEEEEEAKETAQEDATAAPTATFAPAGDSGESVTSVISGMLKPGKELLHQLLKVAQAAHASDIHILSGAVPVLRLPAGMVDLKLPPLNADICEKSLNAILSEDQRRTFMKSGDIDFCYDGGAGLGRFRCNILRQRRGMDGTFRPIPEAVPTLENLKLPEQVRKFTEYRQGIVLITGPKGCGKTTTLAAMVDWINSTLPEHIITMEDPIEFVHVCKKAHVNQREVGTHTGSFGAALRGALREAPDVIVVGEMRDLETTALAISAAETGHLVLATLHTPNAIRTIGRVLDVFPSMQQGQIRAMLSESLRGVISQMLVPAADGKSYELALELLINTPAVANLIRDDRTFQLKGVMQTGKKVGMVLMDESLARLVREGYVKKEDALERSVDPTFFEQELVSHLPKATERCATCKKGELEYAGLVRGDYANFYCPRCESKGAPRKILRLMKSAKQWIED